MKKNKMMRLASSLLVAVLLTSSVISGTFAKYVTADSAEDHARVAKFGATVVASGGLFDESYFTTSNLPGDGDNANVSVLSHNGTDKVVAPGTKNTDGLTFTFAGTPEVDVKVVIEFDETVAKEVFLKAKKYEDGTTGNATDVFELAADYYPVKFTLTYPTGSVTGTYTEIKAKIAELNTKYSKIDANRDLATEIGTINLTWAWAFDGNDKADTTLGNLAAGKKVKVATADALTGSESDAAVDTEYNLDTAIKLTVRIEQID